MEAMNKKAIFFDRDGVLNEDDGYVHSMDQLRWVKGAREAAGRLTKEGWLLFVVTNQSGVARGYHGEEDVVRLGQGMNEEFGKYGALSKYGLDRNRCFLFGDGERDIEAARRAGIQGFLFPGGNLDTFIRKVLPPIKD